MENMALKSVLWSAVFILGMGFGENPATAQILLSINDTDPSAVTVTATGLDPSVNNNTTTANIGVDLLSFFTVDEFNMTFGQDLSGNLEGGGTGVMYNDVYSDNYSTAGSGASYDMELYVDFGSPGQANTQTFSTTQPAFTGSWTIDLSSLGVQASALPAAGTEGNILAGYSGDVGAVIGTWQVQPVPEPAAAGLLALSLPVLGFVIRRGHTASV